MMASHAVAGAHESVRMTPLTTRMTPVTMMRWSVVTMRSTRRHANALDLTKAAVGVIAPQKAVVGKVERRVLQLNPLAVLQVVVNAH